jgi:hypothetical protein
MAKTYANGIDTAPDTPGEGGVFLFISFLKNVRSE